MFTERKYPLPVTTISAEVSVPMLAYIAKHLYFPKSLLVREDSVNTLSGAVPLESDTIPVVL